MTYALTTGSANALDLLLKTGGQETLLLQRPANELRCTLTIEPEADKLQAIINIGPACHSIKLPARDPANGQHLADFVEQIANGVADTAEQPTRRPGVFDRMAASKAPDMVNRPPHYNDHPSGVECIEVTELLDFNLGNAFKYAFRHRTKNGREDLEKCAWYLNRAINAYTLQAAPPTACELATRIAHHEGYALGALLVAIASAKPGAASAHLKHLLDAA